MELSRMRNSVSPVPNYLSCFLSLSSSKPPKTYEATGRITYEPNVADNG